MGHRLLGAALTVALAAATLRLAVEPRVALHPTDVHLRIWTPPVVGNQGVDLAAVSDGLVVSRSWLPLQGADEITEHDWWWRAMPCGKYLVRADLWRRSRVVARADQPLSICPAESERTTVRHKGPPPLRTPRCAHPG